MKFRIAITTEQTSVGDVLAALQESDAKFEDLSIIALRPPAKVLPAPASKAKPSKPKPNNRGKHKQTLQSQAAETLVIQWLKNDFVNVFTTNDARLRLTSANFSASQTYAVLKSLLKDRLIVRDATVDRGRYITTDLLRQKKDPDHGGNEVLQDVQLHG